MSSSTLARLQEGCHALGLSLSGEAQRQLLRYLELLQRWNRAYNLTAVRESDQMLTRHLLDSLAVAPHVQGLRCLDVGTGAGLPGVPLAVAMPQRVFALLDSNGKKTRFLFQVKTALALANMEVHQARVESFNDAGGFDVILSRAFSSLDDMVRSSRHLLADGGRLLAMKGVYPAGELAEVSEQATVLGVHTLSVPGLSEQRHLVEMSLPEAVA
ncbi:MAG: 16S rRNA (guanine(527)-N(7))-methyltransferase RsmG [Pseudomonadota bacterium]